MAKEAHRKLFQLLQGHEGVRAATAARAAAAAKIQQLLSQYPEIAAMASDEDGDLPLHKAAIYPLHATPVLTAVLAAHPSAARTANRAGMLPLHLAAHLQYGPAGLAVVQALITAAPDTVLLPDERGRLPLHWAAERRTGPKLAGAIVETLLEAAPQAALVADEAGNLPLHLACAWQLGGSCMPAVVEALLRARPEAAMVTNKDRCLALHLATVLTPGESCTRVIKALLAAAPQAARVASIKVNPYALPCLTDFSSSTWGYKARSEQVELPLHLAAEWQSGEWGAAVIKALLAAAPDTVRAVDGAGDLALHLALGNMKSGHGPVVDVLLRAAPETAVVASGRDGLFPLHRACADHDPELVRLLFQVAPHMAKVADAEGNLPLHLAASQKSPDSDAAETMTMIKLLLRTAPEAALQPNHSGWLPLHCMSAHHCYQSALELLIRAAPQAVLKLTEMREAPLHVVGVHQQHSTAIGFQIGGGNAGGLNEDDKFFLLLKVAPQAVFVSDWQDEWPRFSLLRRIKEDRSRRSWPIIYEAAAKLVSGWKE